MKKRVRCNLKFELQGWRTCHERIAGVDEVGRGSLFGPVVAAAVILDPACRIRGILDSKQLPPEVREKLAVKIRRGALGWAIGSADAGEIDRINIYQASRAAMQKAVLGLNLLPDLLLIDALRLELAIPQISIIQGDALSVSIAAASILAKVERDSWMRKWDRIYPQYQLAQNKGYSTPDHLAALEKYGPTPQHRYSYEPVAAAALALHSRRQASPPAKRWPNPETAGW